MKHAVERALSLLEYAVVSVPVAGEEESGDLHLVTQTDRGALVAVIDGLGHGSEAANAARAAVATLEPHANEGVDPTGSEMS